MSLLPPHSTEGSPIETNKAEAESPKIERSAKPRFNSAFKHLMNVHWLMATCYLTLFIVGSVMARLPREAPFRAELYDFHKGLAVLVMGLLTWRILVLLRVWWRKYTRRLPKLTPEWIQAFALHTALYLFMWAVPLSGFFFSNSFKSHNVKFLGVVLPDLFPQNSALVSVGRSVHFWLAYTFLAFILLHLLEQRKVVRSLLRRAMNFINRLGKARAARS